LVPNWAEGEYKINPALADVTQLEKSMFFRGPWLEGQRCILPMAGFYVWQLTPANYRQPYFVRLRDRNVFGVAGIWDRSVRDRDDVIESVAIIGVAPNPLLDHGDSKQTSMPAILRRRDYEVWLKGTPVQARAALQSFRADWMQRHAVSPRINSTEFDDPGLRDPIEASA
jgi:putative SOS response-associated peptidase YedK